MRTSQNPVKETGTITIFDGAVFTYRTYPALLRLSRIPFVLCPHTGKITVREFEDQQACRLAPALALDTVCRALGLNRRTGVVRGRVRDLCDFVAHSIALTSVIPPARITPSAYSANARCAALWFQSSLTVPVNVLPTVSVTRTQTGAWSCGFGMPSNLRNWVIVILPPKPKEPLACDQRPCSILRGYGKFGGTMLHRCNILITCIARASDSNSDTLLSIVVICQPSASYVTTQNDGLVRKDRSIIIL